MGILAGEETVMVVEDSDDIRSLICMRLRKTGYHVVEAVNGREAVELAPRLRPGIILMDLSMPVMDGYEATRRIRGSRETGDIPVVAVSALCDADHRRKAFEAGCVECLTKPVDFRALAGVIQKHLYVH